MYNSTKSRSYNMETENMNSMVPSSCKHGEEDGVSLPGFRFHPTDEELVGFYLKRKVEKRTISIELIKHIDIYKYDPWDLPRGSNVGEREWYFYCKRGRKYRNSMRPNRVTGSGFWKATGIDKHIYSNNGEVRECIGLKKSLVYYRGSAGKGFKTDWMMHEFRLPADHDLKPNSHIDANTIGQEAEVWTLCRIIKRNVTHNKKSLPNWKNMPSKRNPQVTTSSSTTNSFESNCCNNDTISQTNYISFTNSANTPLIWSNSEKIDQSLSTNDDRKPLITSDYHPHPGDSTNYQILNGQISSVVSQHHDQTASVLSNTSSFMSCTPDVNEFSNHQAEDYWNELLSAADFASNNPFIL